MRQLIYKGANRKLEKNIGTFNLSYIICPIKTNWCAKFCYAQKAERYKKIRRFRILNYYYSKNKNFVDRINEELKKQKISRLRIHESGDFYNQRYLNKWIKIAKTNPQTMFLTYTKNYKLNFSKIPKNFIVYYSNDPSSRHFRKDLKQAYVVLNPKEKIKNTILCYPIKGKHRHYCGKSCSNCWVGKRNVTFIKH